MLNIKKLLLIPLFAIICTFARIDSVWAVAVSGVTYPFSVTTSSIASGGTFQFELSPKGTFYVDCGDGGTLSGDGVSGGTITRSSTSNTKNYKCTYSSVGEKTIRFASSSVTGYKSGSSAAALTFYLPDHSAQLIESISGDLSAVFPSLGAGQTKNPQFYTTFWSAKITTIPENLFSGYSTCREYMFYNTFYGCKQLTAIPDNLFSNITTGAQKAFYSTFTGCSSLSGSVPFTLFSGLIESGSPDYSNFMQYVFNSSGFSTSCSSDKKQYITGYESYWASKVSCGDPITCSSGSYLPKGTTTCSSSCPANYNCTGGSFGFNYNTDQGLTPNIYTITLRNYDNTATHSTIYEKYKTGWYSNSGATTSISSATVPTRSGYTFRGFYTAKQSDLTASGGSGTRRITNTGGLPSNSQFTANANLYAAWAKNCAPGTGCTCSLNVASNGTVTYTTGANAGYTLTSGSGTYAPVCTANTITLTFDGASTTPAQCTYGGTFVPPTPAPRTGYIFNGWKVKTVNP